ncbi:MAG TPA: FAD/NAD(P)-binding oxidoreductase [Marmoricola sp.]|nr:FAD/NAD(P)-binding oxidoreductase [Marmoricola sp.]HNN47582.1 FAD/NAD(P)-binding oxidoreductase [Marmoricola sp.]HNO39038.1 FAD/NAD(P)-binding oxidoreductase [Marmoricola sp.]
MATTVILGAGVSGHSAAQHLSRALKGTGHKVVMISPNSHWNWIPSNIWVGTGAMPGHKVVFELAPVYKKMKVDFHQARATEIHPEGDGSGKPFVVYERTDEGHVGEQGRVEYDYLINATGPRLTFDKTPGLGPDGGHSLSVCTKDHAEDAARELRKLIEEMRTTGRQATLVVGMGHGQCTCEGAAFEYVYNVDHELREAGVRSQARLVYLTNEAELGDFGVGGMTFSERGFLTDSRMWTESLFREREVEAIVGAGVQRVEPGRVHYESLDGSMHELDFDFAMLLPPFTGVPLAAIGSDGRDLGEEMFAPNGMMKVDARYGITDPEQWSAQDWPETYQSPSFDNIWAVGIAFAPPHAISRGRVTPNGTIIAPSPPRTGMPSGVMGREVALTIANRILRPGQSVERHASMARMGAACVASTGVGLKGGSAASMLMHPIVPDFSTYPETGRSPATTGEIGLSGHWIKLALHHMFLWKARHRPFWYLIPE